MRLFTYDWQIEDETYLGKKETNKKQKSMCVYQKKETERRED